MSRKNDRRRGSSWMLIFLCCVLAVPTVELMLGLYPDGLDNLDAMRPALVTGAILGAAHLILRPILRLISAPLGCLTLGLFGLVIDVGLIYASAYCVEGFTVPGPLYAILTAVLINTICAIAAGRR